MNTLKLVEEITVGEKIVMNEKVLLITDFYEVNGEGQGFITSDENGNEVRFGKSCGVYLEVLN